MQTGIHRDLARMAVFGEPNREDCTEEIPVGPLKSLLLAPPETRVQTDCEQRDQGLGQGLPASGLLNVDQVHDAPEWPRASGASGRASGSASCGSEEVAEMDERRGEAPRRGQSSPHPRHPELHVLDLVGGRTHEPQDHLPLTLVMSAGSGRSAR